MSALQRVFRAEVVFTLHRSDPGPNGGGQLTRRIPVAGSLFATSKGQAMNIQTVTLEGNSTGRALWIALWLDGVVAAKDRLIEPVEVSPGTVVTFDRGKLRVRWSGGG